MAKFIPIIAILMVFAAFKVQGRSLPDNIIKEDSHKLIRILRSTEGDNQSRKPGHLRPSVINRDQEILTNQISKTIADGVLCNVPEALPGTKTPCTKGDYFVEWSPVKNGAASINVYSVLEKVNRF